MGRCQDGDEVYRGFDIGRACVGDDCELSASMTSELMPDAGSEEYIRQAVAGVVSAQRRGQQRALAVSFALAT